ncbi:MAG: hypothetical protein RLZZ219_1452 [Cyanobacteriota bacterium]
MARAARITQLPPEPAEGVLHQIRRLPALGTRAGGSGGIGRIKQLHEGCGQLLGRPPLGLTLEGMPLALTDAQLLMERAGLGLAALRPVLKRIL